MVWITEKSIEKIRTKEKKTDEEMTIVRAYNNPRFIDWLRRDFVHVLVKQRVMDAWFKWSAFGPSDNKHSARDTTMFSWGNPPRVDLIPLVCEFEDGSDRGGDGPITRHGKLLGCTDGRTYSAESIGIAEPMASLIYDDPAAAKNDKSVAEALLRREYLEGVIMHEMIHWSYKVKHMEESDMPGYNGDPEYGTSNFEQEAYGHVLHYDLSKFVYVQPTTEPFFGVSMQVVNNALTISGVKPNASADRAGIKPGDVLVKFDNKPTANNADFDALLKQKQSGDLVSVEVRRGGKVIRVSVTLDDAAFAYIAQFPK